jgi:rhodanese-related sulfurtransferase
VYRAAEAIESPDTLVVVNCAGRTRSILGAQVLINAGLPNRVVSLEGGTQSWVLDGHELDHGKHVAVPLPSGDTLEAAHSAAERFAKTFGVTVIDKATLARFRAEADERSLYVLDVRTPEEFEQGHLPGSRSAPSWDVAPWVFRHVATRNARVVLVDNDNVRATVAASWIIQIGWAEVFVLDDALTGEALETGPVGPTVLDLRDDVELVSPDALHDELRGGSDVAVVDLRPSPDHAAGHVPGSRFAIRAQLAASVDGIAGTGPIVLVSADGALARLAAADLAAATSRPVRVLDGGFPAWRDRGFDVEPGLEHPLHDADDVVRSGWRETDLEARKAGFRWYLAWELGLVAELNQDDTVPFRSFAGPASEVTR